MLYSCCLPVLFYQLLNNIGFCEYRTYFIEAEILRVLGFPASKELNGQEFLNEPFTK